MLIIFIKGLIIGFSISMPVGAIGIICIKKSLHQGFQSGMIAGLGAAVADSFYGFAAGFGLTFITSFIRDHISWVKLIGGMILMYVGYRIYTAKTEKISTKKDRTNNFRTFVSTLMLTLTNPMTVLAFLAIFAGLGLSFSDNGNYFQVSFLILGIFAGAFSWWLCLSGLVSVLRKKITDKTLVYINHISGAVIILFGIWAVTSSLIPKEYLNLEFFVH